MQMRTADVAIIMRTKNRPVLLKRAIGDVLDQKFQNWHLVIVNDGGRAAVVDELVNGFKDKLEDRVTVIHHATSRGMEAASNAGIAASSSQYLVIHDDDDTWHADFLARTVEYLDSSTDAAVGVRTEIVYERLDGETITETGRAPFGPAVPALLLGEILRYNRCVPISLLYRRSLHEEVGGFDENLTAVGDWEFLLRVMQVHPVGFIDGEPLAFWRQRLEATDETANSVLAGNEAHRLYDRVVRDRYLREYAGSQGIAPLLHLEGSIEEHFHHLHQRLNYSESLLHELKAQTERAEERARLLEAAVSDASLVSLIRRRYRRLKDRLPSRA
ncbi:MULTISPECIES: glycosyltransferase family 2 protein [unclassified Arthrobacter]|uniref:glycosyltransferase family 2 protein n=1 Tax=unclassified Arthrobacter TaxID=235627 RepID=UPI002105257C|nr:MULTISPECIES: glycosyltransferase family 2 protein [unclassified Arthrobacter]MCQ1946079.1 glycosyltransferase [Arthrobacter sp. zg-Y1116]MCQ1994240.1 glycosyltransferase [Arthrobacter sp. zg-Y1171]UWX81662.1 glycosyltransferase [Arthrobacter sp. zg-Y1171]